MTHNWKTLYGKKNNPSLERFSGVKWSNSEREISLNPGGLSSGTRKMTRLREVKPIMGSNRNKATTCCIIFFFLISNMEDFYFL